MLQSAFVIQIYGANELDPFKFQNDSVFLSSKGRLCKLGKEGHFPDEQSAQSFADTWLSALGRKDKYEVLVHKLEWHA